jgi:hypothetical protein
MDSSKSLPTLTFFQDCKAMLASTATLVYPVNSLWIMAHYGLTPSSTIDQVKADNCGILEEPIKAKDMVWYIIQNNTLLGNISFTAGVLV